MKELWVSLKRLLLGHCYYGGCKFDGYMGIFTPEADCPIHDRVSTKKSNLK